MEKQMQKNISFLDMIEKYSICVPKIQRDYAQGREDDKTAEIRESFLEEMIESLISKESMPLVLDFVYGSTDNDNVFTPLDGQQRLTTLFLLHWYLLPADRPQLFKDDTSMPRFTYETRISSKDFCKSLVATSPRIIKDNTAMSVSKRENETTKKEWTLSESIQNEPWFLWSWRKDPTIKGMLVMLDAMDKKLKAIPDKISLWNSLTENRKIVFHILPLEQFNLADELYVKMNARGKELSSFDILKSTFEEQMKKNEVSELLQEEWRTHIDSKWMDLFWNKKAIAYLDRSDSNKNKEIVNAVEMSYLRFLKRMMYFHLFMIDDFENPEALDKDKFVEGIKSVRIYVRDHDIITIIPQLSKCGFFNEAFYSFVIETMEQLLFIEDERVKEGSDFITMPFWKIDNRDVSNLFEMFIDNKITYLGRVLFFAQMQFFKYYGAEALQESEKLRKELNNWMRIIRNLSYNTSYNNEDEFRNTIKALDTLAFFVYAESDTKSILDYFAKDGEVLRFDGEQVTEEREKARQILQDTKWENKIEEAECYAFWQGTIRFLFRTNEHKYDWTLFDDRWSKSKRYFNVDGVSDEYKNNNILLRLLICSFTKWESFWGITYDNKASSWGDILSNKKWILPLNSLFIEDPTTFDYMNFNIFHENQNEQSALVHSDLCKSDLLNCIVDGCFLNYRNNQHALYPYNTRAKWKIYVIGNARNSIFSRLLDQNKIELINGECGKLGNYPYFWGWNLYFKHSDVTYYWGTDDRLQKYNNELQTWATENISLENIEDYFSTDNI